MEVISWLDNVFGLSQQWLFEVVFAPLIHAMGLSMFIEDGFEAAEWFLLGLIEVAALFFFVASARKMAPSRGSAFLP